MHNQNSPIRTLVVVGHPASGHEFVLEKIVQAGVAAPNVSKVQQLSPKEITTILLERTDTATGFESEISQIIPSSIWNGLALDLLVANHQQTLWGWADSKAIYLLDYWCKADPAFCFVLVYDSPVRAFVRAFSSQPLDAAKLAQFKQGWQYYSQALLHFYSRHQDRCVLVHVDEVGRDNQSFIQLLRNRWCVSLLDVAQSPPAHSEGLDALFLQIAEQLLTESDYWQEYEALQSLADLPQFDVPAYSAIAVWNDCASISEKSKVVEENPVDSDLEAENELLLMQLHQVQEELERIYLENQILRQGTAQLSIAATRNSHKPAIPKKSVGSGAHLHGAADRIKQQLSYRLGHTLIKQSRSLKGLLALPTALAKQVREFNEDKEARAGEKLPPIECYADAHEAEKVRAHLSYRLGRTLLENYRTPLGWIKLPFAMRKEIVDFKRRRTQRHH